MHRVKNRAPTAKFMSQHAHPQEEEPQDEHVSSLYHQCKESADGRSGLEISPLGGSQVRYESSEEAHSSFNLAPLQQISPEQNLRRAQLPDMTMDAFIRHLDNQQPREMDRSTMRSLESLPSEFGRDSVIHFNSS